VVIFLAALAWVDWVGFKGTVQSINLSKSSMTLKDEDGDLLTIFADSHVKIFDEHGEARTLNSISPDDHLTILRFPQEVVGTSKPGPSPATTLKDVPDAVPLSPEPTERGQ